MNKQKCCRHGLKMPLSIWDMMALRVPQGNKWNETSIQFVEQENLKYWAVTFKRTSLIEISRETNSAHGSSRFKLAKRAKVERSSLYRAM